MTTTSTHPDDTWNNNAVQVFDKVYSPETCLLLHQLATEHSDQIGDDSSIFYRHRHPSRHSDQDNKNNNNNDGRQLTPMEWAIDHILTNICHDTTTNVVEYWARQEYLNMDVHCDIDETLLQKQRCVRCPEYAHILYLVVQLPTNVTAPTCLFPTKRGGWRTTSTTTTTTEHQSEPNQGGILDPTTTTNTVSTAANSPTIPVVDLVVVPAVVGRVVRFPGAMMHAVPRPADQWYRTSTTVRNMEEEEETKEDNGRPMELRSVLLFNCWSNDMPPPIGVTTYDNNDNVRRPNSVPDGVVIDDMADENEQIVETLNDPSIVSPVDFKSTFAIHDNWKTTPITSLDHTNISIPTTTTSTLSVRLMGNKYRRQYNKTVAKLYIHQHNEPALVQAFHEPVTPTRIPLFDRDES